MYYIQNYLLQFIKKCVIIYLPEGDKEKVRKAKMKEVYISISIVDFGNGNNRCTLSQAIDDDPLDIQLIELNKACKLMWELVLAGGKKDIEINRLDCHIVTRHTYIFLPL